MSMESWMRDAPRHGNTEWSEEQAKAKASVNGASLENVKITHSTAWTEEQAKAKAAASGTAVLPGPYTQVPVADLIHRHRAEPAATEPTAKIEALEIKPQPSKAKAKSK
jgi:hypothetical protein